MTAVKWSLAVLLWASGASAVSIGLPSSSGTGLSAVTDLYGNLNVYSVYQPENDLPDQYAALEKIYEALGGDYWNAAYKEDNVVQLQTYESTLSTSSVTYVDFPMFANLLVFKVPWFTTGFSYCRWWGVTCCLTATESVLPTCTRGFQSVGQIALASANLSGVLPTLIFSDLPDLSILFLAQNPGLTGQVVDVPFAITANMLIMQIAATSLQNQCAEAVSGGAEVVYNSSCFSNLFAPDNTKTSTAANKPGLICPSLYLQRPANLSNITTAYYYNNVAADPLLYSFANCSCTHPFIPRYHRDSAGLFQMECVLPDNTAKFWAIVGPGVTLAAVVLVLLVLYLTYRKRLLNEWDTMRINGLKRRHAPGTLMERQGKGMDLFHAGMSLVMTDVEGSTSLWEWNSHIMNSALALHDYTLRSLLPKYFGYEVTTEGDAFIVAFHDPIDAIGWALHVQLALLEAPWPPELLQHDKAKVETCPEGKLLFRGLRVRVAINTGIPAEIIVHNVTKQVEYRGEMMDLTESLSHLPAGGQVLLSNTTSQRTANRLHDIHLPAFTFQCARGSLDRSRSRISLEGLRGIYTKELGSSPSVQSTDPLMGSGGTPTAAMQYGGLQQAKRSSWFSFKHSAASATGSPLTHRQSIDAHIDVAADDQQAAPSAVSTFFTRHFTKGSGLAQAPESTALASLHHSACIIIDMGNFVLSECRNRAYTADDAALPCIAGEHVRQILPEALVERAALFPPFDPASQVAPSFFDAPGAQAAGRVTTRARGVTPSVPTSFSSQYNPLCNASPNSTQRFSQDLPDIAFAFVSESGYKEVASMDKQVGLIALGRFKSCVRTSLLLCDGYECQENEGTFMLAFTSPRAALEWALIFQLALLKVPWGEALLSLPPAKEQHDCTTGQVLSRGLSSKIGLFNGPISRLCPHAVSGRADYLGAAIGRAARLWPICNAGQILVEQSLVNYVGLEWTGIQGTGPIPAAPPSSLALRNYALLVHRLEADTTASQLTCSTTSLSGIIGKQLTLSKRMSTMSRLSRSLPRNASSAACLVPAVSGDDLDPIPAGMPGSDRRRSASMGHSPGPKGDLTRALSRFQDTNASRDIRDIDNWWDRSSGSPLSSPQGSGKVMHLHDNAAFSRTTSNAEDGKPTDDKAAVQNALTEPSRGAEQGTKAEEGAASPKGIATRIPTVPVQVEAYHMGLFTFRGISDKVSLCQVFPASLAGRRQAYNDVSVHGKAAYARKDSSLALAARVLLPDVLHLPLSAEPPLCINMVMPGLAGSRQQRMNSHLR